MKESITKVLIELPSQIPGNLGDEAIISSVCEVLETIPKITKVGVIVNDFTNKYWNYLKNYNVVIHNSNDNIFEKGYTDFVLLGTDVVDGYYHQGRQLRLIEKAVECNMRAHIIGFSFNTDPCPISLAILKRIAPKVNFYLRDIYSFERFKIALNFSGYQTQASIATDLAFLLKSGESIGSEVLNFLNRYKYYTKCIVSIAKPAKNSLDAMRVVRNFLKNSLNTAVILLPHDYRDHNTDIADCAHLKHELDKIGIPNISVYPIDAHSIRYLCTYIDFIITSRMHVAIAGFSMCIPSVALEYQDKMRGIFKLFDMESYVANTQEEWSKNMHKIANNFVEDKSRIAKNIDNVKNIAMQNFNWLNIRRRNFMKYAILTMPRSGSNYLCEILARNGLGIPGEDFNVCYRCSPFAHAIAKGIKAEDYLAQILPARTINGVFATKLMAHWLDALKANMRTTVFSFKEMFDTLFSDTKFILLTRRDHLAQAISYVKAQKTLQWRLRAGDSPIEVEITNEEINEALLFITVNEQKWREVLHFNDINYLAIVYEDLLNDQENVLLRLSEFLGASINPIPQENVSLRVQSSNKSKEICLKYLHDVAEERGDKEFFLNLMNSMVS